MICHKKTVDLMGTQETDLHDVTDQVIEAVSESGVENGLVTVHTPGSTSAVTTIEYEPGCLQDLKDLLDRLAPKNGEYSHNASWEDGNGYSHLRAALLGPSLSIPVEGGGLVLGTWQQVVVCDFDNRPRRREVYIQVLGLAGEAV